MGRDGVFISVEEVEKRFGTAANKAGRIVASAANRALATGGKVLKQETAARYNVRQKDVDLKKVKASWGRPTARISIEESHRNLYGFGNKSAVTPRYPIRSSSVYDPDPKFVRAQVMKAGGKTPLEEAPKPFVQIVNGNIGLFQRTADVSRAPLRGVAAPSIPQIVRNKDVQERFTQEVGEMMVKRVNHEIDRILAEGKK